MSTFPLRIGTPDGLLYEGNVERKEIVRALKQYLPAFMVPNVFRQVEQMPLTKNGKIDRKTLMTEYQEDNR